MQLAVQSSVSLLAGATAHLCRAMAVLASGGSIGFMVVMIFSRGLGRSHGRRLEEGGPRSGGRRECSGWRLLLAEEAMAVTARDMEEQRTQATRESIVTSHGQKCSAGACVWDCEARRRRRSERATWTRTLRAK